MDIRIVPAYNYKQEIKALFKEYTDMLVYNDPVFAKYLDQQNYDKELKDLEKKYGLKPLWQRIIKCPRERLWQDGTL